MLGFLWIRSYFDKKFYCLHRHHHIQSAALLLTTDVAGIFRGEDSCPFHHTVSQFTPFQVSLVPTVSCKGQQMIWKLVWLLLYFMTVSHIISPFPPSLFVSCSQDLCFVLVCIYADVYAYFYCYRCVCFCVYRCVCLFVWEWMHVIVYINAD